MSAASGAAVCIVRDLPFLGLVAVDDEDGRTDARKRGEERDIAARDHERGGVAAWASERGVE